jgi:hypothetical protein
MITSGPPSFKVDGAEHRVTILLFYTLGDRWMPCLDGTKPTGVFPNLRWKARGFDPLLDRDRVHRGTAKQERDRYDQS